MGQDKLSVCITDRPFPLCQVHLLRAHPHDDHAVADHLLPVGVAGLALNPPDLTLLPRPHTHIHQLGLQGREEGVRLQDSRLDV